ncbi:hypothetical protein OEZ86_014247 [Tetradesmus obliquus]|uniref:Thioredoxin domain-containing protein n=1 Tax=Tetradesmus obliquus TaxID=3088 RepID=A0A383V981_TETOB|nr:hypothetical protein OEZ86_014247 [Tetradesmus obliquus]|eukprot:jgi/Sobl393_1/14035/SZX62137.1
MFFDLPDKDSSGRDERGLCEALGDTKQSVVYFYSSKCLLCRSVAPTVEQERERCSSWLNFASVCTDDQAKWAPEMINYEIESVPCFVLLDKQGNAVAKSGRPGGKSHLTTSLQALLRLATNPQQQQKPQQ